MKKISLVLTICLLSVGCVPIPFDLYYMSFESAPGAEVLAYGKSALPRTIGDSPMPINYKLTREEYTVFLDIDTEYWPASFVRVESVKGLELKIVPIVKFMNCGYFDRHIYGEKGLKYEWGRIHGKECPYEGFYNEEQLMKFTVVDSTGSILGEESIPFTFHENGIYIGYDWL
ncbi:MAG: hypothetical protein ACR2PR_07975 [Pseudohongiellaceae bacterium]